ncbi:hypothetical protein [Arthrobacter sp. CJ23]|uniref:hypothetical protein n=1 Tax=Arthrobacter sp. CJ23 TaxID=2972479 RepID=UPI00215CE475|nr:hypothetical protein [Arthrobacter sp. CJ23]UVJ40131.1 hypothetical protein NVV90_02765 [Arthrobacter sp. CJ23]
MTLTVLRDGLFRGNMDDALSLGFLALVYSAAVLGLGEIVSNRRLAVTGTPHLELFRAMELPIHQVVLRYGILPLVRRLGLLWFAAALFLTVFFEVSPRYLATVVATVAVLLVTTAAALHCVLRFASSAARRNTLSWSFGLLALTVGLLIGGATAPLLSHVRAAGAWDAGSALFESTAAVACAVSLAATGASGLFSLRLWRGLAYRKILLATPVTSRKKRRLTLASILLSELFHSRQGSVVGVIALSWIAVVGSLLGASGVLRLDSSLDGGDLQRSLIGVTLVLSLGVTEPTLYRIGPTAKLYALRFAWENGNSARSIVTGLIGVYFLIGGAIGLFVFCSAFLALGIMDMGIILTGVIVMAAGIIAEALARPATSTDGTKAADIMDALYTLLLVSPCSLILVLSPARSTILLLGYTILLTLGATACLRTHLLKLRSHSSP